jgi:hypothetical protein
MAVQLRRHADERRRNSDQAIQLSWNKRRFHYGKIADVVGSRWARRAAEGFAATSSPTYDIDTESKRFRALGKFVEFLGAQEKLSPTGASARALRDMRSRLPRMDWATYQMAAHEFRSCLADLNSERIVKSKGLVTRNGLLANLTCALRRLAKAQILPSGLKLKSLRRENTYGVTTPTLADLERKHRVTGAPIQAADETFDLDHKQFIRRNNILLTALIDCGSKDLLQQLANSQAGDRILADNASYDADALVARLSDLTKDLAAGREMPSKNEVIELLVRYYGKVPYIRGRCKFWHLGNYVGWQEVRSRLQPTQVAFIAALIIFHAHTGWPQAQGRSLPLNPFGSEVKNGKQRVVTVSAIKMRAKGKRIEITLEDKPVYADLSIKNRGNGISGIRALKIWQALTAKLRASPHTVAGTADGSFWAVRFGSKGPLYVPSPLDIAAYLREFRERHKDHPLIGGLPITFRVIRRTFQVVNRHRNPEELLRAQFDAGHENSGMTLAYLGVNSLRRALEKEIRKFTKHLEVAFLSGLKRAAFHLNIPERRFRYLKALAAKKLGDELFLSTYDAPQERQARKENETASIKLSLRRFVANAESLEALYLSHRALRESIENFTAKNVTRWAKVWLPYYALVTALVKKIERSSFASKYRSASRAAESRLASGQVVLPAVW